MNCLWINQEKNSSVKTCSEPLSPELISRHNCQIKTNVYINPQIVKCNYIKRPFVDGHLPSENKIHVNPNFKGNELYNVKQSNGTHTNPSVLSNYSQKTCHLVLRKNGFQTSVPPNNVSKFKKINVSSEKKYVSTYKWVKMDSNINKTVAPENHHNFSSCYKYTAPTKIMKIINSNDKRLAANEQKHSLRYLSKTKIINHLKTKVVNNSTAKNKPNIKQSQLKKHKTQSQFASQRNIKSSMQKVANSVRNKYKYYKTNKNIKHSKFKIDKRKNKPEVFIKKSEAVRVQDIGNLFPKCFFSRVKLPFKRNNYLKSNSYQNNLLLPNKHSWRKNKASGGKCQESNCFPNKRVVKIGGILYKSTVNKLTLATSKRQTEVSKQLNAIKQKAKKNHTVYVRGEKFILDNNGKTLKRQAKNSMNHKTSSSTLKRIDIGGVTYIQKSPNILERTNVHQARYLVSRAKYKSIKTLAKLYKRSTMPCMIYHKFGRCKRHSLGLCMYKHDSKNIAICKRFLKGDCSDKSCLLSHEVIQEKMATCHFFLSGNCTRENCPFLHIKLNDKASICEDFLQGFCSKGKDCFKRHLNQCPEFEKNGTCSKGTKCLYPHKIEKPKESLSQLSQKNLESKEHKEVVQYYVKPIQFLARESKPKQKKKLVSKLKDKKLAKKEGKNKRKCDQRNIASEETESIECVPKRIKLEDLPCFIPLNPDL